MIAVGVITAPRPTPTLGASIASLYGSAGYQGRVIISSDDVQPYVTGHDCDWFVNEPPLGNFRNWVACAQRLVDTTREPWLCVCEDDITWARNAMMHLERDIHAHLKDWATAGCFSLYLPIRMAQECERAMATKTLPRGWWYQGMQLGRKMWGAQALLFKRERLEDMLSSATLLKFYEDPKWTKNVDGIVAQAIEARGLNIVWRVPCLVDHTLGDANSSLGYPDDRPKLRSKYFTGEG